MKKITILIIIKLFLFTLLLNAQSEETSNIILDPNLIEKKYEPMDIYEKPVDLPSVNKKNDSEINLDVDVNKEQKQIDRLKVDVDKKF